MEGDFTVESDRAVVVHLGEMAVDSKISHLQETGCKHPPQTNMSYSLSALKVVISGIMYGSIIGIIKGDTRSYLDYEHGTQ